MLTSPPQSPTQSLQDDLALALRLADAADAISLPRFGADDLQVTAKPDLTPVSDADLAVERAIRSVLAIERPDDAIVGEEFGESATRLRPSLQPDRGPALGGRSDRRDEKLTSAASRCGPH